MLSAVTQTLIRAKPLHPGFRLLRRLCSLTAAARPELWSGRRGTAARTSSWETSRRWHASAASPRRAPTSC
eukprot:838084-Prymnesium_polylepis.1